MNDPWQSFAMVFIGITGKHLANPGGSTMLISIIRLKIANISSTSPFQPLSSSLNAIFPAHVMF
jgi:hypothetical protein